MKLYACYQIGEYEQFKDEFCEEFYDSFDGERHSFHFFIKGSRGELVEFRVMNPLHRVQNNDFEYSLRVEGYTRTGKGIEQITATFTVPKVKLKR